jgi:hypothetical protein
VQCGKFELSSDGGDTGSKNVKEAMVAPRVRSGETALGRSLESGCRFCVRAFGRNLVCRSKLIYLIYFIRLL